VKKPSIGKLFMLGIESQRARRISNSYHTGEQAVLIHNRATAALSRWNLFPV